MGEFEKLQQEIEDGLRRIPHDSEICSGAILGLPPIRIVQDAKGEPLDKPLTLRLPLSGEDCERLIALGVKTPFGKGSQKLQDDEVRLGWQLEPQQLSIPTTRFARALLPSSKMMKSIHRALCADAKSVSAEFYKLVVYGVGGHFVKHRDTLRSANHVGTLLIGLPTEDGFEGGELVVDQPTGEPFRMSAEDWNFDDMSSSYVAFFTDAEHELRPITKGYRLTMMYHIMAEFEPKSQDVKEEESPEDCEEKESDNEEKTEGKGVPSKSLVSAVEQMLQLMQETKPVKPELHWRWRSPGTAAEHVGFMLEHKYSFANAKLEFLRGRDAVLYSQLARDGNETKLLARVEPVVVHATRNFRYSNEMEVFRGVSVFLNGDKDWGADVSTFDLDVQEDELLYTRLGRYMEGISYTPEKPSSTVNHPSGPVRFFGEVSLDKMWPRYVTPGNEHTGNEPAAEELSYHHVALIVSLASHPLSASVRSEGRRPRHLERLGKSEYHASHITHTESEEDEENTEDEDEDQGEEEGEGESEGEGEGEGEGE